jgi:hypothetical protein
MRKSGQYFAENSFPDGSIITIVDFAPRLVRIVRKITQAEAIPPNLRLAIFPIATPGIKTSELPLLETKGTLAYVIRNQAAITPCPSLVFGAGELS